MLRWSMDMAENKVCRPPVLLTLYRRVKVPPGKVSSLTVGLPARRMSRESLPSHAAGYSLKECVVTRLACPPCADITKTSIEPSLLLAKANSVPSGLHRGVPS